MAYGEIYEEFVEKFKPKKTTDDCYTPENLYNAVKEWAIEEYNLQDYRIIRPFWPAGDYKEADYSGDCVVIDNPPFSILSEIHKWYTANEIKFFLFAPNLTMFSTGQKNVNYVLCDETITYENGAEVNTSFITNLGNKFIRTAPVLKQKIKEENKKNNIKKQFPKYKYPANVVSAALLNKISSIDFEIDKNQAHFVGKLDLQNGKKIYGGGFLISNEKALELKAAELKAAELKIDTNVFVWELSEREKEIISRLSEVTP